MGVAEQLSSEILLVMGHDGTESGARQIDVDPELVLHDLFGGPVRGSLVGLPQERFFGLTCEATAISLGPDRVDVLDERSVEGGFINIQRCDPFGELSLGLHLARVQAVQLREGTLGYASEQLGLGHSLLGLSLLLLLLLGAGLLLLGLRGLGGDPPGMLGDCQLIFCSLDGITFLLVLGVRFPEILRVFIGFEVESVAMREHGRAGNLPEHII